MEIMHLEIGKTVFYMMHHPHYDVDSACKLFLGIHTTTLLYNVGTFNEQHHLISSTLCITNALV